VLVTTAIAISAHISDRPTVSPIDTADFLFSGSVTSCYSNGGDNLIAAAAAQIILSYSPGGA